MKKDLIGKPEGPDLAALIEGPCPVFVKFYATWCGPCRSMEPVFERLASRFAGSVHFANLDVDMTGGLASEHQIRSIPTFLLFVGGREVGRVVGVNSEAALAALLEFHTAQHQGCAS